MDGGAESISHEMLFLSLGCALQYTINPPSPSSSPLALQPPISPPLILPYDPSLE